jgi:hypothetical protein
MTEEMNPAPEPVLPILWRDMSAIGIADRFAIGRRQI